MGTTTARLGLYKPADVGEIVDVDDLNDNADAIDLHINGRVVTSGTRPPSPFEGQIIKETDTKATYQWDAASGNWILLSRPYAQPGGALYNPGYSLAISGSLGAVTAMAGMDITVVVPPRTTCRWDMGIPAVTVAATSDVQIRMNRQVNAGAASFEQGWSFANPTAGQFTVPCFMSYAYVNEGMLPATVRVWVDGYKNGSNGAAQARDGMPVTFKAYLL